MLRYTGAALRGHRPRGSRCSAFHARANAKALAAGPRRSGVRHERRQRRPRGHARAPVARRFLRRGEQRERVPARGHVDFR